MRLTSILLYIHLCRTLTLTVIPPLYAYWWVPQCVLPCTLLCVLPCVLLCVLVTLHILKCLEPYCNQSINCVIYLHTVPDLHPLPTVPICQYVNPDILNNSPTELYIFNTCGLVQIPIILKTSKLDLIEHQVCMCFTISYKHRI